MYYYLSGLSHLLNIWLDVFHCFGKIQVFYLLTYCPSHIIYHHSLFWNSFTCMLEFLTVSFIHIMLFSLFYFSLCLNKNILYWLIYQFISSVFNCVLSHVTVLCRPKLSFQFFRIPIWYFYVFFIYSFEILASTSNLNRGRILYSNQGKLLWSHVSVFLRHDIFLFAFTPFRGPNWKPGMINRAHQIG